LEVQTDGFLLLENGSADPPGFFHTALNSTRPMHPPSFEWQVPLIAGFPRCHHLASCRRPLAPPQPNLPGRPRGTAGCRRCRSCPTRRPLPPPLAAVAGFIIVVARLLQACTGLRRRPWPSSQHHLVPINSSCLRPPFVDSFPGAAALFPGRNRSISGRSEESHR